MPSSRFVVGISGASGVIYGIRFLEVLKEMGMEVHLVITRMAQRAIEIETSYKVAEVEALATVCYDFRDQTAWIASGSSKARGMVIIPCSMKTLAGIACGYAENLLLRAADVAIKERRPLILVCRETPLSSIHLRNMLILADMGVIIFPPMPSFYSRPQTLSEIIDHFVGRVLDTLHIEHELCQRWVGEPLNVSEA